MSILLYFLLPPMMFVGAMVLMFKLLEAIGVTSTLDFDLQPREATVRKQIVRR
jgi:hypothetical protein